MNICMGFGGWLGVAFLGTLIGILICIAVAKADRRLKDDSRS